jgi:uncharacterized protein
MGTFHRSTPISEAAIQPGWRRRFLLQSNNQNGMAGSKLSYRQIIAQILGEIHHKKHKRDNKHKTGREKGVLMRVLITGATGLIGRQISRLLSAEGHQIVVLSRRPESARVVSGASVYPWQMGSPPVQALEGVEAVIHLAGEPVTTSRWSNEQKRRIRDSRVIGTRHLVDAIKSVTDRPKVLVSASAVGFYGDRGEEELDERSAPGKGFLSEVCLEWEREATSAEGLGLRVAVVRVGVVLSPTGGALEKMLPPFRLGIGGRIGNGRHWFPWIHIGDIAGIFKHALTTSGLSGVINGVAPGVVRNEEFTKELAAALHRPVFLPVPEWALRLMIGEMVEVVMASQRIIPRVALDSGYRFHYQALRPALQNLLKS